MDADGLSKLAARLRAVPGLGPEIARVAAPLLLAAAKRTAAAGTTPEGTPWDPKKRGGRPLANAADALTVSTSGDVIELRLSGVNVYHHHGVKGGATQRRILPDGGAGLPKTFADAIDVAARGVIGRTFE